MSALASPNLGEFTYRDLQKLPEDEQYELIHGHLYALASPVRVHQRLVVELMYQIRQFLEGKDCELFIAPYDVLLADEGVALLDTPTVLQPDLMVICDKEKNREKHIVGAPEWVIEIISPSSATRDLGVKAGLFERYGTNEYWVMNPDDKTVTIWQRSSKDSHFDIIKLEKAEGKLSVGTLPGLSIDWDYIIAKAFT